MATILIIEDERDLAELIAFQLQQAGHESTICNDGQSGLTAALATPPDLVVLDVMLPELLGTEVCRELRRAPATQSVPVLMLTARSAESDRVIGFEIGADDYLTKPFSVRELVLRVQALLRRSVAPAATTQVLRLGELSIDSDRHTVTVAGAAVALTSTEYKLLLTLVERRGRLQSRDTLLQDVWGYHYVGDTRTVDTHITRLRTKLGVAGELIQTVRGFGYKLEQG